MKLLFLLGIVLGQAQGAKLVDLKDGFVRVETPAYSFEIPKGWEVSAETPYGARDMTPAKGAGTLGAMTAPPTTQSWDQLYKTSLFFILREKDGKATPYVLGKAKQGYERMSFEVADEDGFASRRYVILKSKANRILALSVKLTSKKDEKVFVGYFDRMISSARIN